MDGILSVMRSQSSDAVPIPRPAAAGNAWAQALRAEARRLSRARRVPDTLEEWSAGKHRLRAAILRAAGFQRHHGDLAVQRHGTLARPGYTFETLSFQSRRNLRVTANLFLPEGRGPFPAVLNVHGHWPRGKAAAAVLERCQVLALEGFIVLSVDAAGSGERGGDGRVFDTHGDQKGAAILAAGETLLGLQIQDNMRGIDLLAAMEAVDPRRIGAMGASGGGNQTMWLAAMDPRISAAVPVTSVGTFEAYVTNRNCWCETLPGGLAAAEAWEVLGLAAPCALMVLTAADEDIAAFLPKEAARTCAAARMIYRLHGASARFDFRIVPGPHGFFPAMQRHALGWFKKWLQGSGDGGPARLPDSEALPEDDALCFAKHPRPRSFPTLLTYLSEAARRAERARAARPAGNPATERRALRKALCLRAPPEPPRLTGLGRLPNGERQAAFSVLSEGSVKIPCEIRFPSRRPLQDIHLAVHSAGRSAALGSLVLHRLAEEGAAVCAADLRDLGENSWDHPEENLRHAARANLWVGRTILGNWTSDLLAVGGALRRRFPGCRVHLRATGEPGLAVLAAAALSRIFASAAVEALPATFEAGSTAPAHSHAIYLPKMLLWGDVTRIAALTECPLTVVSLAGSSGKPLEVRPASAWRRKVQSLRKRMP